uniref:C-type lectin domain-containing protein n=1 Tax=Caenorhabditis japonica TaxID=281687 RepID=A0A8R1HKC9_CAEJA
MITIFAFLTTTLFAVVSADNECPYGYKFYPETAICYHVSEQLFDFDGAVNYCENTDGKLVSLIQGERQGVTNLTSHLFVQPWIASRRNLTTRVWYNIDGSVFITGQWASGEPTITNGNCATFRGKAETSGLQATQCYQQQYAFCKIVPNLCNGGVQNGSFGSIQSPQYPDHLTGNLTEQEFSSKGSLLLVVFRTNYVITDTGFYATWNVQRIQPPIVANETTSGELHSPNYPSNYNTFDKQLYYIQVKTGARINVTIDDFSTQPTFDFLEIYSSWNQTFTKPVTRISGNLTTPWTWLSPGNEVSLKFVSDGSQEYRGWHMLWSMVENE